MEWLNSSRSSKDKSRVVALLSTSEQMIQLTGGRRSHLLNDQDDARYERLIRRLNRMLGRYVSRPIFVFEDEKGEWAIDRVSGEQRSSRRERHAIQVIEELASIGRLNSIRRCGWCKRWILARVERQTFCNGGTCRQKAYESSDTFKSHRREYMRRYYRLKSSGKVK